MPWRLILAPRAEKDLEAMSRREREAMARALERLVANPGAVDLRKLSGQTDQWRLRMGRWRAILELDNETGTVRLLRVLPRGRAYRG